MPAATFTIRGKVQGVWFRASTRDQALRLGLGGHALNLPDGGVEVFAQGDADALAALEKWLWQGPPLARVEAVVKGEAVAIDELRGFAIG
jgi:acylphosphatase